MSVFVDKYFLAGFDGTKNEVNFSRFFSWPRQMDVGCEDVADAVLASNNRSFTVGERQKCGY